MQSLSQLPPPLSKLTPLPDFVTSYHNPTDEWGNSTAHSQSMAAPRAARRNHHQSSTMTSVSPPAGAPGTESSAPGMFQYESVRRTNGDNMELSAPIQSGSADEKRAMCDGMTELLNEKIIDLGRVMKRVQNVLPIDLEPEGIEEQTLDLAIEYLHMSDHSGPAASRKLSAAMLKKVDSLGKLAKRLKVEIPSDVDRKSNLYDLRSYYRGHRGVDIYADAGITRKKKDDRPQTPGSNSDFQAALAALDPQEFYPDRSPQISGGMEGSIDYDETWAMEDSTSSLIRRGGNKNGDKLLSKSSSVGALSLARQNLVRMQDDQRSRVTQRRRNQMRKQRSLLNKIAESYAVRALPNQSLVYEFNKTPPIELDSELILGYVADSMRIVEGSHSERVFRNYFTAGTSRRAFSLLFWKTYLIHFQNKAKNNAQIDAKDQDERRKKLSEREADIMSQNLVLQQMSEFLAATYVQVLSSVKVETHKPVFYRYYSTALSEAIYQALYFYFPGSRNIYNNTFKRKIMAEVAETMSGMRIEPVSASIMSASVFGHVIIDDNDNGKKKNEGGFGGAQMAGYSTKPRRFQEPSIWIPTGKRAPRQAASATHMSPLVRHFLGQPVGRFGSLDPLPTKRTKPSTTRYRLPDAFKMIGKAEDRMMELRANYNFKVNQFGSDKQFDRKMVKQETKELEKEKQRVLFSNASDRQRYAFQILDEHKKAITEKKRRAELQRR